MTQLPENALLQYGAIGILALVAMLFAYKFWTRADEAYKKEVERGDRLEQELLALNKLINEQLAGDLVRATEAIRDVVDLMRRRRGRW